MARTRTIEKSGGLSVSQGLMLQMETIPHWQLVPSVYNPRKISQAKFASLVESIRTNGFVEPIVVQRSQLAIVGGHQRHKALAAIYGDSVGGVGVPCVMLDIDDRKARLLNIALNNTEGEFDDSKLRELLVGLNAEVPIAATEMVAAGFSEAELNRLLSPPVEADGGGKSFAHSVTLSLSFDSVPERDAVKGLLAEVSQRTNQKSGTIVRKLLERDRARKRKVRNEGVG